MVPEAPRPGASREGVNESFGSNVPAFQASIPFFVCYYAHTRAWLPRNSSQDSWFCKLLLKQVTAPVFGGGGPLLTTGASRLCSLPIRSNHEPANDFQTSLEEAVGKRPGREAG